MRGKVKRTGPIGIDHPSSAHCEHTERCRIARIEGLRRGGGLFKGWTRDAHLDHGPAMVQIPANSVAVIAQVHKHRHARFKGIVDCPKASLPRFGIEIHVKKPGLTDKPQVSSMQALHRVSQISKPSPGGLSIDNAEIAKGRVRAIEQGGSRDHVCLPKVVEERLSLWIIADIVADQPHFASEPIERGRRGPPHVV